MEPAGAKRAACWWASFGGEGRKGAKRKESGLEFRFQLFRLGEEKRKSQ